MELRVVQIGNSGGILIPKEARQGMGIRIGENVSAEFRGKKMIITNPKKNRTTSIDAKFAKIVDEFMDEHKDVLSELAKR